MALAEIVPTVVQTKTGPPTELATNDMLEPSPLSQ